MYYKYSKMRDFTLLRIKGFAPRHSIVLYYIFGRMYLGIYNYYIFYINSHFIVLSSYIRNNYHFLYIKYVFGNNNMYLGITICIWE